MLKICCKAHPRYRAIRKPASSCKTCHVLYILRWQNSAECGQHLGGLEPYQFVVSGDRELLEALGDLVVAPAHS